jgi:hypothetical protein
VADVSVVVRFHRSPVIVPVAGGGGDGDVELGAVGSIFEWLLQPASPKASSRTLLKFFINRSGNTLELVAQGDGRRVLR